MQMEYKTFPFEMEELDDAGTFWGYASVFNNPDASWPMPEVVEPGAFAKTLKERGHKVRICHQHDWKELIGTPLELREDERGLFVRAKLVLDVQRAREDYALMRAGALDELSIGYQVVKDEPGDVGGTKVRRLKELRLYEISPVTVAANDQAVITGVKAAWNAGAPNADPAVETEPIEEPSQVTEETAAAEPGASSLTAQLTARERLDLYNLSRKYLEA